MVSSRLVLTALKGLPLVKEGEDLVQMIVHGLQSAEVELEDFDVIVIAQKIVSKAEGRMVDLITVEPSDKAKQLGELTFKDPRLVELILRESSEVLRVTQGDSKTDTEGKLIVRHKLGFVLANAGIDTSNINQARGEFTKDRALLLPENPDQSCEAIRKGLDQYFDARIGVVINDSHGRAWREGSVGISLGVAGIPALKDMRGCEDLFGQKLQTTVSGYCDEISAAASILMGQAKEAQPIVHIRGLHFEPQESSVQELIRPLQEDLFR